MRLHRIRPPLPYSRLSCWQSATLRLPARRQCPCLALTPSWSAPRTCIAASASWPTSRAASRSTSGDTVHWVQNGNEIHTVTFLGGSSQPALLLPASLLGLPPTPSPLVFNPRPWIASARGGLGDTTTFVNSGLMGREAGQYPLLRPHVHGRGHVRLPLPGAWRDDVGHDQGRRAQRARRLSRSGACTRHATRSRGRWPKRRPWSVRRSGRSSRPRRIPTAPMTHYVALGYSKGQIDLMRFFPSKLRVRPGDTVVWEMTPLQRRPAHGDVPQRSTRARTGRPGAAAYGPRCCTSTRRCSSRPRSRQHLS